MGHEAAYGKVSGRISCICAFVTTMLANSACVCTACREPLPESAKKLRNF